MDERGTRKVGLHPRKRKRERHSLGQRGERSPLHRVADAGANILIGLGDSNGRSGVGDDGEGNANQRVVSGHGRWDVWGSETIRNGFKSQFASKGCVWSLR